MASMKGNLKTIISMGSEDIFHMMVSIISVGSWAERNMDLENMFMMMERKGKAPGIRDHIRVQPTCQNQYRDLKNQTISRKNDKTDVSMKYLIEYNLVNTFYLYVFFYI